MNRAVRMRTGTCGGLKGWGREAPAYSLPLVFGAVWRSGKELEP